MKRKLLILSVVLTTTIQFFNAQCSRVGSFVQSDPAYSISGDANITITTTGDKDVIFQPNFATVQGADLRVYLSKTDDINTAGSDAVQISDQLENDAGGFGGPGTSPITGMKTFSIPASTNLEEFDFIIIHCIAINERWGYVALGNPSGSDCSLLSVNDRTLEDTVEFYPNPFQEKLTIENNNLVDLDVEIYDVLGKMVFNLNISEIRNQNINLSTLKTGVYLIKITAEGNSITKRLVKQ